MHIGYKIAALRKDKGLSQEKLAEMLEVSRQSVYKWESGESYPDRDKIARMVDLFGVSYDFLLNDEVGLEGRYAPAPEEKAEPASAPKPLATCSICGKKIENAKDLVHHAAKFQGTGKNRVMVSQAYDTCRECEVKEEKAAKQKEFAEMRKRKNRAIGWGIAISAVVIAILVAVMVASELQTGLIVALSIVCVLIFPTVFSIVIDNCFAGELWTEVATWGFVQMPGVIFSLDFDGIVFLITAKILLFLLSLVLAIGSALLATVLTMALSPIAFPLSIYRYVSAKKEYSRYL